MRVCLLERMGWGGGVGPKKVWIVCVCGGGYHIQDEEVISFPNDLVRYRLMYFLAIW